MLLSGDFYVMRLWQVYNPSTGDVITDVPCMGRRETNDAISSAFNAFNSMSVLIGLLCYYALFWKKHFYCFIVACANLDSTLPKSVRALSLSIKDNFYFVLFIL